MTSNKDLKRLVRARMQKTGEAYTSARAALLRKRPATVAATPEAYAQIAGMSDAALKAKTGCTWEKWVRSLDHHGAATKSHAEIAALINTKYKTGSWWSQMVAVGYERIRGLRVRGQQRDGSFQATKSRTFAVPVETLFDAWADSATRKQWMNGATFRVRTSTKPRSMRIGWTDGSIVSAVFTAKGRHKSAVAVEQVKLESRDAVVRTKEEWAARFDALRTVLASA